MKKKYFFIRKNGRVIKECISMKNNAQVRNYLNQLIAMFGRKNVLVASNDTCLAVELFYK